MLQLRLNNFYLLFIMVMATCFLTYSFNYLLITKDIYYNTFQNQLDYTRIDELFNFQAKYAWIGFIFIPIWLLLKNFVVSLCLQTGLILNNTKLKFGLTFRIALTAEFVFLLPQLIKLAWFLLVKTDYTLTDIQQFYPLSALNLFKIENLSSLLIYPFQTFNIFEFIYWIVLAGGIKQALNADIDQGIRVVFSGYIPALVLWVLCIMFITVSISPST